jgi:hypothetical protein
MNIFFDIIADKLKSRIVQKKNHNDFDKIMMNNRDFDIFTVIPDQYRFVLSCDSVLFLITVPPSSKNSLSA